MILRILALTIFATVAFSNVSFAADLAKGKASYTTNCASCHGDKGDGMGPAGQYMNPKPRNFAKDKFKAGKDRKSVINTITKGLPNTAMVGFGHLKKEEIEAIADYVLSFK